MCHIGRVGLWGCEFVGLGVCGLGSVRACGFCCDFFTHFDVTICRHKPCVFIV